MFLRAKNTNWNTVLDRSVIALIGEPENDRCKTEKVRFALLYTIEPPTDYTFRLHLVLISKSFKTKKVPFASCSYLFFGSLAKCL